MYLKKHYFQRKMFDAADKPASTMLKQPYPTRFIINFLKGQDIYIFFFWKLANWILQKNHCKFMTTHYLCFF